VHEEQLVDVQPLHEDEDETLTEDPSLDDPDDFVKKPHFDISLERSRLLQEGHSGTSLPRTRASKALSHLLHLYSNMGISMNLSLTLILITGPGSIRCFEPVAHFIYCSSVLKNSNVLAMIYFCKD